MALRLSIRSLEGNNASISRFRDAFSNLKNTPDDRDFDWFAALQGLPYPAWCEHGSPLFLPWHRAFFYYFEMALQTRLGALLTEIAPGNPDFEDIGLPWWDWASAHSHTVGLTLSYAGAVANGSGNPLFNSEIGASPGGTQTSGIWSATLMNLVRTQRPGLVTVTDPPTTLRDPDDADDLPRQTGSHSVPFWQTKPLTPITCVRI